jgi:hypothetical protein
MNDENPIKEYKSFFDRFKKKRNKDIQVIAEQDEQSNKDFEETFEDNYNLNEYKIYIDGQYIKPIKIEKTWYETERSIEGTHIRWDDKLILIFIENKNTYNKLVKNPIIKINNKTFYISDGYTQRNTTIKENLIKFKLIEC